MNNVGFSERADVPIEPRLSEQWFLKYPSVEASKACVAQPGDSTAGQMRFFPTAGRRCTTTGWAASRTGASAGNCGGTPHPGVDQ